ncbi:MBL fold metallo-hydrolase [Chloroflexota bacterium]
MEDNTVKIAYFGAAVFDITTDKGKRILIDPYITQNSLCHKKLEYFNDVNLLLVSHGSYDHLGDTIEIMKQSQATLICGGDVARYCIKMGIPKERIKSTVYGDEKEFEGIKIKAVYARHQSKVESGTEIFYGAPLGFIVTTENDIRIYHTGDTALFDDFKLIGMYYRPNIFLVGISGMGGGCPYRDGCRRGVTGYSMGCTRRCHSHALPNRVRCPLEIS